MNKRKRFVLASLLLTLGLAGTQLVQINQRYEAIAVLTLISVALSAWALFSDLKGIGWLTVLTLPAMYPASVALFYFLLPANPLARGLLLILFGLGMYALLLTENIYSVAAIRTIQLVRAAHAVGFLLTILTSIFFIGTIFSLRLPFWANGLGGALVLFPLLLQGCWSVILSAQLNFPVIRRSLILAIIGGGIAVVSSFLPMNPIVAALLTSGYLYVVMGLSQQELQERLFKKTIQEYVAIGIIVLLAAIIVTYF